MPRTVKEFDARYQEFLDVAQRLFYANGYAQTSVQQIIDAMGVAKGLFYYYFRSKDDLLDAVIARMTEQLLRELTPMVEDPTLDAPAKLTCFFARTQSWKLANKAFMLDLLKVIYRDDNMLLSTKIAAATTPMVVPLLSKIIRQGIDEGTFDVQYPEESAEIILKIGQAMAENVAHAFLRWHSGEELEQAYETVERGVHAYERGMERVLGAAPGTLRVVEIEQLRQWFV
jgi:AcrR family transcriptional regulator